jgi:hypothetical protein
MRIMGIKKTSIQVIIYTLLPEHLRNRLPCKNVCEPLLLNTVADGLL